LAGKGSERGFVGALVVTVTNRERERERARVWGRGSERGFGGGVRAAVEVFITTGIQGFTECCILCRVPFVGHSAKKALPSAALGDARLSATRLFTECWTLGKD
jgi:hypothetical protein